ncbi:hypothetical protein COOONC_27114 [Cooperia oncophora]
MIWQSYLCFEEAMLAGDENNEEQRKTVASLYKRALRVPSVDIADTWNSYLEFAGEQVDDEIRQIHEATVNEMKEFSKFELKLAETDDSLEAFYEYLSFEKGEWFRLSNVSIWGRGLFFCRSIDQRERVCFSSYILNIRVFD